MNRSRPSSGSTGRGSPPSATGRITIDAGEHRGKPSHRPYEQRRLRHIRITASSGLRDSAYGVVREILRTSRDGGGVQAGPRLEFLEDVLDVLVHGPRTDREPDRDLRVRKAFGQAAEHLSLALRELADAVDPVAFLLPRASRGFNRVQEAVRVDELPTGGGLAHRPEHLLDPPHRIHDAERASFNPGDKEGIVDEVVADEDQR